MCPIKGVRKQLSEELGFLISPVRIRDDLDLAPNGYRISVMGVPVGTGEVLIDRDLAIDPVVTLHYVELPTVVLGDEAAEAALIQAALAAEWDLRDVAVPLRLLPGLHPTIAAGQRAVTVHCTGPLAPTSMCRATTVRISRTITVCAEL